MINQNNNRETTLLGEPANVVRLPYITKMLDSFDLKEGTRILDFGGNQFKDYCKSNNFIYNTIDLEEPQKTEQVDIMVVG